MDINFNNFGKKISWVQILFLLCIILLAVCTLIVLSTGEIRKIGVPLFIVGAVTIIVAAIKKSTLKGRMWLISDGAATAVLSAFLLSGITTPLSFALWEISLGGFKIGEALRLNNELHGNSRGFLFIGIAEIVSGAGFFIKSADRPTELAIAIAITFAIQMSAYALRYYLYPLMTED